MEPFLCFPLELKQWLSFAAVPELSIDNRTCLPLRLPDRYLLSMPNLIATYYSIASRPLISNICLFMVHLYVYTWVCVWYMHMYVRTKANFKCPVLSLCPFSFLRRGLSLNLELDWPQTASVALQSLTAQHCNAVTDAGRTTLPLPSSFGLWGVKLDCGVNPLIH